MADNGSEVREKLERTLGQKLPEPVWDKLVDGGYIKDYQDRNNPFSWQELRDEVALELRYANALVEDRLRNLEGKHPSQASREPRSRPPPEEPREHESFKVKFTSWESARAVAHTLHVAELADRNLYVQAFRERILGKAYPLNAFQVRWLVESPAAAFFPPEWFESWAVPIVGHRSEIKGQYFDNRHGREVDHRATVQFTEYSADYSNEYSPVKPWLIRKYGRIRVRYALGPPPSTEKIDVQRVKRRHVLHGTEAVPPKPAYILSSDERPRPNYIWPGSVLAELKELSKKLARLYWHTEGGEISAARFILTGEPTLILPLEVETKVEPQIRYTGDLQVDWFIEERLPEAEVRLTVQPWVHADRVREIYRKVQRQIVGSAKQPLGNLMPYIFVKENHLEDHEGDSEPFHMYNAQAPKNERYSRPHGFWQAYKNARDKVENFYYRRPGW